MTPGRISRPGSKALALLALFWAGGGLGQEPADPPPYPAREWHYADAAERAAMGWSEEGLRATEAYIRDDTHLTGLVVVERGRVAYTFGDIEELSYLASVRKSVLAILYGPYVEDGTIELGRSLRDLGVDDVGGLLETEKDATVGHLVTARSGIYHAAANGGDNLAEAPPRGSQPPGSYMLYNNWDFNAAGALFEQLTGVGIYDALEQRLALPLEFEDWDRSAQRKTGDLERSRNPAYHMWLSTRDMARIGYLMLRSGRWQDRQLFSEHWIRTISSVVTPLGEMNPPWRRDGYLGYGFMWWVWDGPRAVGPFQGAYTARGDMGQWISVFPALDLVLAIKTKKAYGRRTGWPAYEGLLERLFTARAIAPEGPWPWQGSGGSTPESE